MLEERIAQKIFYIAQKQELLKALNNCDKVVEYFESIKPNMGNAGNRIISKFKIFDIRARLSMALSSLPGTSNISELQQSALQDFKAISKLKGLKYIGGNSIVAEMNATRLQGIMASEANDIKQLKIVHDSFVTQMSTLGIFRAFAGHVWLGAIVSAVKIYELDSSEKKYKDIAIRNSKSALAAPHISVAISSAIAKSLVKIHILDRNWQVAAEIAGNYCKSHSVFLHKNQNQIDIRAHAAYLQEIGDLAAYCYCMINEPTLALIAAEQSRSIYWKFNAARKSGFPNFVSRFSLNTVRLNKQVPDRVNILISVCAYGVCWITTWSNEDGNHVTCEVRKSLNTQLVQEHIFGNGGYLSSYVEFLGKTQTGNLDQLKSASSSWNNAISKTLEWLWIHLMQEINQSLENNGHDHGVHVHILPSGLLGLLPILSGGTIQDSKSWQCFSDNWITSVSDSLSHEHFCDPWGKLTADNDLDLKIVGITNPTMDLGIDVNPAANMENFLDLVGNQATKKNVIAALKSSSIIYFFCHAHCDLLSPGNSYFQLHDGERLTLEDISDLRLFNNPAIILASCETGLYEALNPNEAQGLSAGLLWAGASVLTSTFWPVNVDTAKAVTSNLSEQMMDGKKLPEALCCLQRSMRSGVVSANSNFPVGAKSNMRDHLGEVFAETKNHTMPHKESSDILNDFTQPLHWAVFGIHMR